MKPIDFVWAIRRMTGDWPAEELLTALRSMLRTNYKVHTFAQISPPQYGTCLVDVIHTCMGYEARVRNARVDSACESVRLFGSLLTPSVK